MVKRCLVFTVYPPEPQILLTAFIKESFIRPTRGHYKQPQKRSGHRLGLNFPRIPFENSKSPQNPRESGGEHLQSMIPCNPVVHDGRGPAGPRAPVIYLSVSISSKSCTGYRGLLVLYQIYLGYCSMFRITTIRGIRLPTATVLGSSFLIRIKRISLPPTSMDVKTLVTST